EAKTGGARGETDVLPSKGEAELRMIEKHYAHYRDSLYFLFKHFRGRELLGWIWYTYRHNVGLSKNPKRLYRKNVRFFRALRQARYDARNSQPPYFVTQK